MSYLATNKNSNAESKRRDLNEKRLEDKTILFVL